jgi:hypothetical protein
VVRYNRAASRSGMIENEVAARGVIENEAALLQKVNDLTGLEGG